MVRITVDRAAIATFCRKHHIRKLAFFGSVPRDDFRPDSDIDVLVEFEPGHTPGFIRLAGLEFEFSPLLGGRTVEMKTAEDLSRYFRHEVVATAEVCYPRAR